MQSSMSLELYTMTIETWGVRVVNAPGHVLTPQNIMPKWQIMIDKCLETGKKRLLVESSGFILELDVPHLYELIDFMVAKGFQGGKIAFVLPGWKGTPESELLQTIAFNRGIYSLIFKKSDSAIAWLRE